MELVGNVVKLGAVLRLPNFEDHAHGAAAHLHQVGDGIGLDHPWVVGYVWEQVHELSVGGGEGIVPADARGRRRGDADRGRAAVRKVRGEVGVLHVPSGLAIEKGVVVCLTVIHGLELEEAGEGLHLVRLGRLLGGVRGKEGGSRGRHVDRDDRDAREKEIKADEMERRSAGTFLAGGAL